MREPWAEEAHMKFFLITNDRTDMGSIICPHIPYNFIWALWKLPTLGIYHRFWPNCQKGDLYKTTNGVTYTTIRKNGIYVLGWQKKTVANFLKFVPVVNWMNTNINIQGFHYFDRDRRLALNPKGLNFFKNVFTVFQAFKKYPCLSTFMVFKQIYWLRLGHFLVGLFTWISNVTKTWAAIHGVNQPAAASTNSDMPSPNRRLRHLQSWMSISYQLPWGNPTWANRGS